MGVENEAVSENAGSAEHLVGAAGAHFNAVVTGTGDPLHRAAAGLECLWRAAMAASDLSKFEGASSLQSSLAAAAPKIATLIGHRIPPSDIYIKLGATAGLLDACADFNPERVALARLLAAEIEVIILRRYLARRGDPVNRYIRIRAAQDAETGVGTPIH